MTLLETIPAAAGRIVRRAVPLLLLVPLVAPRPLAAQTTGELAAFSALMVSPIGALPPLARESGAPLPDRWNVSLRYGGWRYDIDDGMHNNVGATVARRLGNSRSTLALSAAYLSLDCDCAVWLSTGATLRSVLWSTAGRSAPIQPRAFHVANSIGLGFARYSGTGHATAYSISDAIDLGAGVPFVFGTHLALSLLPGVGRGALSSIDETGDAWRPMIGGALSWSINSRLSLDLGFNRIVVVGGPPQGGGGLSWRLP